MTRRGGGTCTVRNTRPSGVSCMPLLPVRRPSRSTSFNGSRSTSSALTSRSSPLSTLVTTIAARRAARSALRAERISSFTGPSLYLFDEHADGAAARQPDLPGGLVGDAEFQHLRLAVLDHVHGLGDHGALDAAARHRAEEIALLVDDKVGADRPRRRAPG